mmetsp:Transcript_11313/g.37653  ORF Transcript_11313/g.37653 Transcript_11313/m.37653 type:complete len:242 (+) Transcript_11313:329-1054(+)
MAHGWLFCRAFRDPAVALSRLPAPVLQPAPLPRPAPLPLEPGRLLLRLAHLRLDPLLLVARGLARLLTRRLPGHGDSSGRGRLARDVPLHLGAEPALLRRRERRGQWRGGDRPAPSRVGHLPLEPSLLLLGLANLRVDERLLLARRKLLPRRLLRRRARQCRRRVGRRVLLHGTLGYGTFPERDRAELGLEGLNLARRAIRGSGQGSKALSRNRGRTRLSLAWRALERPSSTSGAVCHLAL